MAATAMSATLHLWRRPVLWLALLTHAVLATAYLVHTPAFEGPDENDHCYYAAYLQHTGALPRISDNPPMTGGMLAHHPPLYYALLAAITDLAGTGDYTPSWQPNPAFPARSALKWLHGHDEQPPVSAEIRMLRLMRSVSVLCGLVTIALTARLALALFPAWPRIADVAALGLACVPQWSWVHGCLDNGNLAATLATAAVLLMVRALQRGAGARHGLMLGAVVGLALITKLTAIFLLPLLLLTAALLLRRGPRARAAGWVAAALAAVAALAGWSFARNLALYGDPLGLSAHAQAFAGSRVPDGALASYLRSEFAARTFGSTLAGFGWSTVRLPAVVEWCAVALLGGALFGWMRARRALCAAAGAALWLPALATALVAASVVRYNLTYVQPQGRYLFPGFGAAAVLIAAGLVVPWQHRARARGRRWRGLLALPPLGAALVFLLLFRPSLAVAATAPSPFYAALIEGLAAPPPPARALIRALDPPDGAVLAQAPTFRWEDPGNRPDCRYSVHLVIAAGVPIATWESAGIEIKALQWTMPPHYWESLRGLGPFQWKVRRLPDRARGEGVSDVPESALRALRRAE